MQADQFPHRGEPVGRCLVEERADLVRFPGLDLGLAVLRQLDPADRIERDQASVHGIVQCVAERVPDPLDRRRPGRLGLARAGGLDLPESLVDVVGPQAHQRHLAQPRLEVHAQVALIGAAGARP
ncbi:hypothetical protein [Pseudofrankia inefficax]|uniref:hypothetical protein n=1 Tax=Pseudofrankia inefficax (strain DSM 45817 / CECT 9037 / DDB 130130 / EuI1c) TaxID=298654 RepID=UPI001E462074|nr:hypothetical protein [Pseudofrankia inefficax]